MHAPSYDTPTDCGQPLDRPRSESGAPSRVVAAGGRPSGNLAAAASKINRARRRQRLLEDAFSRHGAPGLQLFLDRLEAVYGDLAFDRRLEDLVESDPPCDHAGGVTVSDIIVLPAARRSQRAAAIKQRAADHLEHLIEDFDTLIAIGEIDTTASDAIDCARLLLRNEHLKFKGHVEPVVVGEVH